jgi:hypothetical protein
MQPRELEYRGYKIRLFQGDDGWRIRAKPLSPEDPILARHSFFVPASCEDEAAEYAKGLVDKLLRD